MEKLSNQKPTIQLELSLSQADLEKNSVTYQSKVSFLQPVKTALWLLIPSLFKNYTPSLNLVISKVPGFTPSDEEMLQFLQTSASLKKQPRLVLDMVSLG